jgi:hypothetical protein
MQPHSVLEGPDELPAIKESLSSHAAPFTHYKVEGPGDAKDTRGEGLFLKNSGPLLPVGASPEGTSPLQRIVSLPRLNPGTQIGAVVYLHGHRNLKYVTSQYGEIISTTVRSGWAFVSPSDGCPDQLLDVLLWVRSQIWSNQNVICLGLRGFELLHYLKVTGQDPRLGPNYLFYFDETTERGWHSTNRSEVIDLNVCLVSVHDEIIRTLEPQWGREHPFMEWLRSLNPKSHQICHPTSQHLLGVGAVSIDTTLCRGDTHEVDGPLTPTYTISGWMNSHVVDAVDLIDLSVMTVIGPWRNISTKTLNAALRDWLAFTGSSSGGSGSRGGIYVIPTPSTRWREGYYNLVAPIKLQRQTLGYSSQGRATYRWKKIDLPWGLVNGCVEMSLSSNLSTLRQEMQDSRSGWEGVIQLEGRVGVWGSPRLRMRVGSPSSTPRQISLTPPSRAMQSPSPSVGDQSSPTLPTLGTGGTAQEVHSPTARPHFLPGAMQDSINRGNWSSGQSTDLKLPMPLDLQPAISAPSTLQAETYCLCAQLYTSKGELVSYGYCNPKYPGLIDLQLRPFFLPPIIGATENSDHTSRTVHSNPTLRARTPVSDPHLHGLHLFLTQSWLPTVAPGNNSTVMLLRDAILELPLVVKEDCKISNILVPEADLHILPSQHSNRIEEQSRFFDIKTYESRTAEGGNTGTLQASFGINGDCQIQIFDRLNADWLRSDVKISQQGFSIALVSSKSDPATPAVTLASGIDDHSGFNTETHSSSASIEDSPSSQQLPSIERLITNDSVIPSQTALTVPLLRVGASPFGTSPLAKGLSFSVASTDSL